MKKMWLLLSLVVFLFGFVGCEDSPVEPQKKGGDGVLGGEENSLVGAWYEVNSADNWGTIVTFTETTMSIIGYGFTSYSHTWKDTLIMYTDNLGYKITNDDTLEFEYRPPLCKDIPSYTVSYKFKSPDTLFIEKIWSNNALSVYPPLVSDILLYRRKNK